MRAVLSLIVLLLTTGAAPQSDAQGAPDAPGRPAPGEAPEVSEKVCRDRIIAVREERGLPRLEEETAWPYEPLRIYAVDKRVDGCSVLVMHGNVNDIRPLPSSATEPRLMPAR